MTSTKTDARDWSATLFLPKTDFPMKAGLPQLEPRLLERWARIDLYRRLREAAKGRPKFILHDGPPYANGNIHIGTALNKILKDMVTRGQQMLGYDSNYVPGWDCHGLPIEWKIEEQYRAKGLDKDKVPVNEFRKECREFAEHWIGVQREEFKRLGVEGDWEHYYSTMAYKAEATIADELMKFAMNGGLYRGSKPVMWSVVEKTALAEAEVEYHDYQSDTVWVKFPVVRSTGSGEQTLARGAVVLLCRDLDHHALDDPRQPGDQLLAKIEYGLFEVTGAPDGNWAKPGDRLVLATKLAPAVMKAAKVETYQKLFDVDFSALAAMSLASTRCVPWATSSTCPCSKAITSPTRTAPASSTPRPATAARTSISGRRRHPSCSARHRHDHPLHRRRRRALHQGRAGLRGQARHRRQGQQGRRQPGGDRCADQSRCADRARPPEAPVSAFLALQEAGDLPQYAAVVHRHGQAAAHRRRRRNRAPPPVTDRGGGRRSGHAARDGAARPSPRPSSCPPRDRTACAA